MNFIKNNPEISSYIEKYEDSYNYFINAYIELLTKRKQLNLIDNKNLKKYLKHKNKNLTKIINNFEDNCTVVYKISSELASILEIDYNYNYTEQDMAELIKIYEQKLIEHYNTKDEELVDILVNHIKRIVLI